MDEKELGITLETYEEALRIACENLSEASSGEISPEQFRILVERSAYARLFRLDRESVIKLSQIIEKFREIVPEDKFKEIIEEVIPQPKEEESENDD